MPSYMCERNELFQIRTTCTSRWSVSVNEVISIPILGWISKRVGLSRIITDVEYLHRLPACLIPMGSHGIRWHLSPEVVRHTESGLVPCR